MVSFDPDKLDLAQMLRDLVLNRPMQGYAKQWQADLEAQFPDAILPGRRGLILPQESLYAMSLQPKGFSLLQELNVTRHQLSASRPEQLRKISSFTHLDAEWLAESAAATALDGDDLGQVALLPERMVLYLEISREDFSGVTSASMAYLADALPSIIERGLLAQVCTKVCALDPVTNYDTTDAAAVPSLATFEAMAAELDDVEHSKVSFLANSAVAGLLKKTQAGTAGPTLWSNGNTMFGYRAYASDKMAPEYLALGDFRDVSVCFYGPAVLNFDPITSAHVGKLKLTLELMADVRVLRAESFALVKNAAAS